MLSPFQKNRHHPRSSLRRSLHCITGTGLRTSRIWGDPWSFHDLTGVSMGFWNEPIHIIHKAIWALPSVGICTPAWCRWNLRSLMRKTATICYGDDPISSIASPSPTMTHILHHPMGVTTCCMSWPWRGHDENCRAMQSWNHALHLSSDDQPTGNTRCLAGRAAPPVTRCCSAHVKAEGQLHSMHTFFSSIVGLVHRQKQAWIPSALHCFTSKFAIRGPVVLKHRRIWGIAMFFSNAIDDAETYATGVLISPTFKLKEGTRSMNQQHLLRVHS